VASPPAPVRAPSAPAPVDAARAALLIVNADDFGLTHSINEGIVHAHRYGIVTAAGLMPTARAFEHAVELARECPELDVGVHLTLDEERALLSQRTITNGDGRFLRRGRLIARLVARRVDLDEVEREWEAQVQRVLDSGLRPSFVNGHGHIHAFPALLPIAVRVAARHGIRAVRRPIDWPGLGDGPSDVARATLVSASARRAFKRLGGRIGTADRFSGLAESGELSPDAVAALCRTLRPGLTELMAHPGYADEETRRDYGYWKYDWEGELRALTDGSLPQVLLTTFRQLFA
jgi:predicted glycoside hydrolase/deacetylase ChbG (UPF0249 family)